jgi:biotin carboxylase
VLLLVPSATYRASDFLEAAGALGLEVVVGCDEAPALASNGALAHIGLDDPDLAADAIVAMDAVTPLDAVVAVDDQGTLAAARASARLGLRANDPAAVAAARDKSRMRTLLSGAEVPQPAFGVVAPAAGAAELEVLLATVGLPCVVKPTSLSGSQGVIRADTLVEALRAVERVRSIAAAAGREPGEPLLLEQFVPGPEVAVEAMLTKGELTVLAVFDKPDPLDGPYFEETIYLTPSRLEAADLAAVGAATQAATRALGLTDGPVHAELRVRDGRAWVIEVAARSIGGLCSRTLRFGTGRSLEYLILAHALGRHLDAVAAPGAAGVLMLPISTGGVLVEVSGRQEALEIPGIVEVDITIPPGRELVPLPEGNRYLGFVFARGDSPERVEKALRSALACLRVRVEPERPLRRPVDGR